MMELEGLNKLKKNHLIGIRARDLPACSIVFLFLVAVLILVNSGWIREVTAKIYLKEENYGLVKP
jgi:hypothetical protein